MFFKDIKKIIGIIPIIVILITGCSNNNAQSNQVENSNNSSTITTQESSISKSEDDGEISQNITTESNSNDTEESMFEGYKLIEVDGGDLSGHREPNVVVDIGFGDRKYWAFTNEYGQLVKVIAKEIILQDESKEPVTSKGRYYPDEAKVPGVESKYLDEFLSAMEINTKEVDNIFEEEMKNRFFKTIKALKSDVS